MVQLFEVHIIVGIISVVVCLVNFFSISKIISRTSGGFRKAYTIMSIAILAILVLSIILLLGDFGKVDLQSDSINLTIDLLVVLSVILITWATRKIRYIVDFMPKGILDKFNQYL
ncbi:MAG: hypothetical protein WCP89_02860 [archaeon]